MVIHNDAAAYDLPPTEAAMDLAAADDDAEDDEGAGQRLFFSLQAASCLMEATFSQKAAVDDETTVRALAAAMRRGCG